jgi:hypothetical protein
MLTENQTLNRAGIPCKPEHLDDEHLEWVLLTKAELHSMGACDALFGDMPRWPGSITYMAAYDRRVQGGTFGSGKRHPGGSFLRWDESNLA